MLMKQKNQKKIELIKNVKKNQHQNWMSNQLDNKHKFKKKKKIVKIKIIHIVNFQMITSEEKVNAS